VTVTARIPGQPIAKPGPFLKWAGGKRQLWSEIQQHIPPRFGRYFEPFVGGGAVFFALGHCAAVLNDANDLLVKTYIAVRDEPWTVMHHLEEYAKRHSPEHYLMIRSVLMRQPANPAVTAARVIYLNKTCFNGLWRVSKRKGEFNVPMDPASLQSRTICDSAGLKQASAALKGVKITCLDFVDAVVHAAAGDFVYFDPPYVPVNDTSDFRAYTKAGFAFEDHGRLMKCALQLKKRGVKVLLSNADLPVVRDLYKTGFDMRPVQARRSINSKTDRRGKVGELLIW
jgi:DNA adenine methylase